MEKLRRTMIDEPTIKQSQTEAVREKKPVLKKYVALSILLAGFALLILSVISARVFGRMDPYVLDATTDKSTAVGIVFGAGIRPDGKPYSELQARLDAGAEALQKGVVQKLILSGDNRFYNYNEPEAMKTYLIAERGIREEALQVDYAGRSTYETCERARKVFSVREAILFSANSHLPRAIFICRSFGIESYGIGVSNEANNASRREFLARIKALFNVYVIGENTILGEKIDLAL